MDKEELKQFIKDNLVIETESVQKYTQGNDVRVSLRFSDDEDSFTSEIVYIPDND